MTGLSYSAAQVRAQDIDRFHLALVAPAEVQAGWLALAAFNLELARTASRVSDPNLGLIRLQWWREVVAELAGQAPVRAHQVALALSAVRDRLDINALNLMVQARERDLEPDPFPDLETLRAYLMQTSGSLLGAQAKLLGIEGAEGMANHLGCAFGFVGCARALGGGRATTALVPAAWLEDPQSAITNAAGQAALHLDRAQELRAQAKQDAALAPVFKIAALSKSWLKRFERTANPLGQPRFLRPLPFQALRLSFARG